MTKRSLILLWSILAGFAVLPILCTPAAAANLVFTLNTSETVTVTGTPRIAIDVGGITRHATYVSGSGTAALSFAYAVQSGDLDATASLSSRRWTPAAARSPMPRAIRQVRSPSPFRTLRR